MLGGLKAARAVGADASGTQARASANAARRSDCFRWWRNSNTGLPEGTLVAVLYLRRGAAKRVTARILQGRPARNVNRLLGNRSLSESATEPPLPAAARRGPTPGTAPPGRR